MKHLTKEEQLERDAGWIALYGREAYDASIRSTEWVLALPYPPPPAPHAPAAGERGADGSGRQRTEAEALMDAASASDSLVIRAAYGWPELWPAHHVPPLDMVRQARLRLAAAGAGALPRG